MELKLMATPRSVGVMFWRLGPEVGTGTVGLDMVTEAAFTFAVEMSILDEALPAGSAMFCDPWPVVSIQACRV